MTQPLPIKTVEKYALLRENSTTVPGALLETPEQVPVRKDNGKAPWSLRPWDALEEVVKVLEFGAAKYSANNWRTGAGFGYTRVFNSLLRHLFSWFRGEDRDPESGYSHLAHACCNILFLLYYEKYKDRYKNDDRFQP